MTDLDTNNPFKHRTRTITSGATVSLPSGTNPRPKGLPPASHASILTPQLTTMVQLREAGAMDVARTQSPAVWDEPQLKTELKMESTRPSNPFIYQPSKYNPTPGTGRTGVTPVAPNNYPFYNDDERYQPVIQPDGGQLSEWKQMYAPTKEQAEEDRATAYAAGIPHGYRPPGTTETEEDLITLTVISDLHDDTEYGAQVDPKTGLHSGGPFTIQVSPKIRVEQLRRVIRDVGGIIPGLQKLSYAGKRMEDSQRTLEHYGVAYWHKHFPHWPIKIYRF